MIFATDLDTTLIYSKRFTLNDDLIELVEKKEDKEISYMTKNAIQLLKDISKKLTLIPTTARNYEEYKRVSVLQELKPKYVVANVGGSIYIDGIEDLKWKTHIAERTNELQMGYQEVIDKFQSMQVVDDIIEVKLSGDLIWVVKVEAGYDAKRIIPFMEFASEKGWKTALTRNKICILPHFINKWTALDYLSKNHINKKVIAAGDSIWDYDMVIHSDYGIVPKHGEICEQVTSRKVHFTEQEGLLAGEEILEKVLQIYNENKHNKTL